MLKGIVYTLIAGIAYGFAPIISMIVYQNGGNSYTVVFSRYAMMIPISFIIVRMRGVSLKIDKEQMIKLLIIALFGSLLSSLTLYMSYQWINPGVSTAIHFTYPIILLLLSRMIYKDKITHSMKVSFILSSLGVVLIAGIGSVNSLTGILLSLLSAFAYAFYLLFNDKWKLVDVNNMVFLFYVSLFSTLVMLIAYPLGFDIRFNQPLKNYFLMFIITILTSYVGLIFTKEGIKILGSKLTSLISTTEPISAILFSAIILGEVISISTIAGTLLIISSIFFLLKKKK